MNLGEVLKFAEKWRKELERLEQFCTFVIQQEGTVGEAERTLATVRADHQRAVVDYETWQEHTEAHTQQIQERLTHLEEEQADLIGRIYDLRAEAGRLQDHRDALQQETAKLTATVQTLRTEADELASRTETLTARLADLERRRLELAALAQ